MQHKNLSKSSNDDQNSYVAAFKSLEHKVENMFNHLWNNPFAHEEEHTSNLPMLLQGFPKIDLIDRDKELVVKVELPGIDKKDIDVSISNNCLIIKAQTCHEDKEEKGDYLRQETTQREFYRSIALPANVEDDNIVSTFKNGLLELTIPKAKDSHRKKINIE